MKHWLEPQAVDVPPGLREAIGGHPLIAETLVRRGITNVNQARAFLDPALYHPASAFDLPDMDAAVERIERAIRDGETVGVWGDFDVDGQTATTLLVSALRELDANVVFHIPNRQAEGHGITLPALQKFLDSGVDVVLTCDTGIAEHEAVDYAHGRHVDIVITDHHKLTPTLPDAYAVVNPQRLPAAHPLYTLPGVGMAYKLVEALYERTGRSGETDSLLDLVALGIVADVAVQTGDSRYLLQRGLKVLRNTNRLGLRVMMETAELDAREVSEEHIGFMIAPRMNALGRLDDASAIVELLTTDDLARARILATRLEGLNAQRKLYTEQVYGGAVALIERDPSLLEYAALVLTNPHWHTGVVGIAANRLVERYNRPVILLANPPGEMARGSARSVDGCDITAAIAAHQNLLEGFGGHTMAAGLSIQPERIADFRRALSRTVKGMLGEVDITPTLAIDGYLTLSELSLKLVEELNRLGPFGAGNPALTLASRGMVIKDHRVIGRTQEHVKLVVEDESGTTQDVLWWNGAGESLPVGRFDLAYAVSASDYKGERQVQIVWKDARPVGDVDQADTVSTVEVIDCRTERDPARKLAEIRAEYPDLLVWAEGAHTSEVNGSTRSNLKRAHALAIWTIPPYSTELKAALEIVSPRVIYLFGIDPARESAEAFLKRLTGLIKHVLNAKDGQTTLSELAAAAAQRKITVRRGIDWLVAKGQLDVVADDGETIRLAQGTGAASGDVQRIAAQLGDLLSETAAYRREFRRADKDAVIQG